MQQLLDLIQTLYRISPVPLIDIGARWGIQRPWARFPCRHLTLYGFEADADECRRLNETATSLPSTRYFPAALSDEEIPVTLYVTQEEGCSSIYKPNYKYLNKYYFYDQWRISKTVTIQSTTLKRLCLANDIKPDF